MFCIGDDAKGKMNRLSELYFGRGEGKSVPYRTWNLLPCRKNESCQGNSRFFSTRSFNFSRLKFAFLLSQDLRWKCLYPEINSIYRPTFVIFRRNDVIYVKTKKDIRVSAYSTPF